MGETGGSAKFKKSIPVGHGAVPGHVSKDLYRMAHPPFSMSVVDPKGEEGEGLVGETEENFWDCLSDGEG